MTSLKHTILAISTLAVGLLAPGVAHAKRPGVLEDKPIVERKLELRKLRLQVTPYAGMSIAQPVFHVVSFGGKLQFDFTDSLGVRGNFDFMPIALKTELTTKILDTLPVADEDGLRPDDKKDELAPLKNDFQHGVTRLQWLGSADVVFTPFSGKLGLFSSIFTEMDLYVFGGVGFTNWVAQYPDVKSTSDALGLTPNTSNTSVAEGACEDRDKVTNAECVLRPVKRDEGMKIGASFGAGFHIFLSDWLAINPEVQDIIIRHNDTGFSSNREVVPVVDSKDAVLRHNATFRLGFTFYVPTKAKRRTTKP
jgi:outer membrane beta-barrel protein